MNKKLLSLLLLLALNTQFAFAKSSSTSNVGFDQGGDRFYVGSGGTLDIETSGVFAIAGTQVTPTAAQFNVLTGVVPGTSAASKAVVLDASSKINTLDLTAMKIGGASMTATAAELNTLAGVTAGTSAASKAVVLDASSKINTIDVTSLKLGGTTVSATAAQLNQLNDSLSYSDGIGRVKLASVTYDFAVNGGAISAIPLAVTIPANAIILDGMVDVKTTFQTEGADAGTVAISVEGANDIVSAVAVSDGTNPWDAGLHNIIPVGSAATAVKTTQARAVTVTIAGQAVTAGKMVIFLRYIQSI